MRDSDLARQKLTKLTGRGRVTDANSRDVYTGGVIQKHIRCLAFGRGLASMTATPHKVPQVFPVSFDKAIIIDVLGDGHLK